MIKFRHFKKGLVFGLPVGIAVGFSSGHYTGSGIRGVITGLAITLLGGLVQGWLDAKAEQRRQKRGITLVNVPMRTKLILKFKLAPEHLIALSKEAMRSSDLRIKRIEIDEPLRIVAITRLSFYSFSERVSVQAKSDGHGHCELEISSVPRVDTTVVDGGTNYINVYSLAKFIKDHIANDAFIHEALIDLDKETECH